jgi:serine/threonine protein kinase
MKENMNRIWISKELFVWVDDAGFLVGPYYEGALGCVIPALGDDEGLKKQALKIPRMLADTVRENANIARITEDESDVVHNKVRFGAGGGVGLAAAQTPSHPLRGYQELQNATEHDARLQSGHVIFVSFVKGRPPRFCTAKASNGETKDPGKGLSVFPAGVRQDLGGLPNAWDNLVDLSTSRTGFGEKALETPFTLSVCYITSTGNAASVCALNETIIAQDSETVWFAGVPSILYEWCGGTIEQAISLGLLKQWSLEKCFTFFKTVLTGLDTLHSSGLLHGDIRPANIMAVGDRKKPDRYKLIDYGSFARNPAGPAHEPTGDTMAGTGIGPQRVSPFYSPERRAGVERESADTAIILRVPEGAKRTDRAGSSFLIRVGWRTSLVAPDGQSPDPKIVKEMKDEQLAGGSPGESPEDEKAIAQPPQRSEDLFDGDRLRLQDYLFEIIAARRDGDMLICRCKARYSKIYHDRLAVFEMDPKIADKTVLSLPRYVEYRQWSAASDIYSVGALFLYCLFASSPRSTSAERAGIQSRFGDLIEVLENVSYFEVFWPELEDFRRRLEDHYDLNRAKDGAGAELVGVEDEGDRTINLRELAIRAVNNIVQSAPHVKMVLARFDNNVAKFLLFMHFVMACVHRRTDLPPPTEKAKLIPAAKIELPFATSRLDRPESRISSLASLRLERIASLLDKDAMFGPFKATEEEVPDYNPKSDPLVRRDNRRLEIENQQLKSVNNSFALRYKLLRSQIPTWQQQADNAGGFGRRKELLNRILKVELQTILDVPPSKEPGDVPPLGR